MGQVQVLEDLHRGHLGLVVDILDNQMDVLGVLVQHSCCHRMDLPGLVVGLLVDHEVVQVLVGSHGILEVQSIRILGILLVVGVEGNHQVEDILQEDHQELLNMVGNQDNLAEMLEDSLGIQWEVQGVVSEMEDCVEMECRMVENVEKVLLWVLVVEMGLGMACLVEPAC